ncbi:type II toxin-antitoxin system RelE/ParE family toxin [Desulfovibrio sp. JC022]|uniref:type II toxin-antitoxin system RelE/ParE family toxin n=1 Tax=Desulfovibrio sp. JC022 TaxID=2593642 RepID=UPI0034D760A9
MFAPEAEDQILKIYHYISEVESAEIAAKFTNAIIDFCESLQKLPFRGNKRDDISKDLRVIHYKKRTSIAYAVFEERVAILGVFYGGQNYAEKLNNQ